jgi:peptide/nickel transport system substrate-binding protein
MKQRLGIVTALALSIALGAPMARAETPSDTLIQAWAIDDIISLDPAEVFEFTASEMLGNTYQPLIGYQFDDVSKVFGVVAESWTISEDGKTISFKIREGNKFASGNPVTAADAVFSLQRAVKLDKSPAFIIGQFGITPENADTAIKQTGDYSFDFTMDQAYAPSLVLYALTATVAYVVDKDLVMSHAEGDDFGYGWLKTHYAGSGPFTIREWRANDVVVMERNDNYVGDAPAMARVIYRHIPEPATERLLLEKGDIDIARKLGPEEFAAFASSPDVTIDSGVKGSLYYLGLNQKNEYLAKPEVREAFKYLVNYQEIADTIMNGGVTVHQAFLPKGFLGAIDDAPYAVNVAKAKELLAKAGLPDGFTVTMDTRNTADITGIATAIQKTMAEAGITLEIVPMDEKQQLTRYRAREHDIFIGKWGPDYQDPHTNADTFASNPDNGDDTSAKTLAWRNAWDIPEETAETKAAMLEPDAAKRAAMYEALQRESQQISPFVIMFQEIERMAIRSNVEGVVVGPSFQDNRFDGVTKD